MTLRILAELAANSGWALEPDGAYSRNDFPTYALHCSDGASALGESQIKAKGRGHGIWIGYGADVSSIKAVEMSGQGNMIFFGPHCRMGAGSIVRLKGRGCVFYFGAFSTAQSNLTIVVSEGGKVLIGDECMLSSRIVIDNSDHHSIFDVTTGLAINRDRDVLLERHVWVGRDVRISKGATIGSDAVIGQASVVLGNVEPNSVYAGVPAGLRRTNTTWSRYKAESLEQALASEKALILEKQKSALIERITRLTPPAL